MACCCLGLDIFNTIASGNLSGEALSEQVRTQWIWCHEDMQQETAPGVNGWNGVWERALLAQGSEILLSVCSIIKPRDTEMALMEMCKYKHTQMLYAWAFCFRSRVPACLLQCRKEGPWQPASLNSKWGLFVASCLLSINWVSENRYSRPTHWCICFIHKATAPSISHDKWCQYYHRLVLDLTHMEHKYWYLLQTDVTVLGEVPCTR